MNMTEATLQSRFPNEIDLPRAEDFCRGALNKGDLCCTLGWMYEVMPKGIAGVHCAFRDAWTKNAEDMGLTFGTDLSMSMPGVNDDMSNTTEQLATCFERAIRDLGYDID